MTFRTRTFVAILIACAMALAASTALVTTSLRRTMLADIEGAMLRQVRLAAELLSDRGTLADPDAEAAVISRLIDSRVTFIRADGVVIGDSDVDAAALDSVDNHLMREEVQEALSTGTGAAVRQSHTTGVETMYAAAGVRNGPVAFVRIGLPLTSVHDHLASARRLAWGGLGAGLLAALLITWATSTWLSRRVQAIAAMSARYREGDFTRPTTDFGRDEIGTVARVLDETARQLGGRLAEVARERAHMDAVLQGMVEGAVLVNRQGKLVITNPAVRKMLRLPVNPEGRHFLEVVRQPEVAAQLSAALTGARPGPVEVQLDSQSRRSFVARAVPVDADREGGAVLVLHDVTELRQADLVRRDFVANASHELRTPLTAIRGYVEALMDAPGDPVLADKFLAIIARHAERMDRLVTDLLRLARLDARQETLQPARTPVAPLFTSVVSEMETAIQARRLRVQTSIAPDAHDTYGDPAKLHDVLRNLLENAINYSPEDGEVTIDASRDDGAVEIAVSDRGPGIPDADLSRIFERFYRVDRSRTRDPGGTGLGLSIVKHLVELHGGRVFARNREGGGASVVVRLPDAPARSSA
ncbi:MAG TPA: ATP-binding protein [Vicinamibacterales bacterium]|nr:ATP-binding protein [Vicinamibacterales bacterium]